MQHKMTDILNGTVSTQQFSVFVRENLPNFFQFICRKDMHMYGALAILHDISNAQFEMLPEESSSTDQASVEFLHSLQLAVIPQIDRIEKMFADA